MKLHLIPGALALGLATLTPVLAETPAAEKPADAKKEAPAEKPAAPAGAEAPAAPAAPEIAPEKIKPTSSYVFGFQTGRRFAQETSRYGITTADIDAENFVKGFNEGFAGKEPSMKEEELNAAMQALGQSLEKREQELAAKNLEAGKKFLEENGKRKEVTTTKSGLQYEVLAKGGDKKYAEPKEGEPEKQFMVNYKGTLIDGKKFDESPAGEPVPMSLQVIPGFKEALTTMPIGSKWKLFIPSGLAYGEQRRSAELGPNSTLIFELELVDIKDAPKAPEGLPFQLPGQGGAPAGGAPEGE